MATQTVPRERSRHLHISSQVVGYLLVAPPMILVIGLIFFPALESTIHTLTDKATNAPSLARYVAFFNDKIDVANLTFTIEITLVAVFVLFLVCLPIAIYLRFSRSRITAWVQSLTLFPLFVPGIMLSYALIRFFRPHGMVESILNIVAYTGYKTPYLRPSGIVIGLVWEGIPFTVLVLTAGLQQVDDSLIECARDVGANTFQVFLRIILPLIQRPAMIVLCLNFIGIFGSYTIPYLLGPAEPQMMGVLMQSTFQEFRLPDDAEMQAVITFLVSLLVGILYVRTIAQQRAAGGKNE